MYSAYTSIHKYKKKGNDVEGVTTTTTRKKNKNNI